MPRLTKRKKRSRKACEAKVKYQSIEHKVPVDVENVFDHDDSKDLNISFDNELERYDDDFVCNELIENDNAVKIIRKFQEVAKEHYLEHAFYKARRSYYIGNSICTKRRKNQQQYKAAKGTAMLHTFWDTKKSIKKNNTTSKLSDVSDYEIEDNN